MTTVILSELRMRDDSRISTVDGQKIIPSTRSIPRTPKLNVGYGVGGKRVKVWNNSNPKPKNAKVQNIEIRGAGESNFCSEGRRFDFFVHLLSDNTFFFYIQ